MISSTRRCGGGDDDDGLDLSDQRTPAQDGLGREAGGGGEARGERRGVLLLCGAEPLGPASPPPPARRAPARSARLGLADRKSVV